MRRLAPIVVLFSLLASVPGVAEAASVRGRVRDAASDSPLTAVTVRLFLRLDTGGEVVLGTMSGADGSYSFEPIPPGTHRIRFTHVGYTAREDSVTVSEERVYTLDASLAVAPIPIAGVAVEADRLAETRDEQTGFVSLDARRLASLPGIAEGDPIRALQLIPGVQTASDFSSALYVRGGGPDQTLVLLDRTTVYNPTHAFGFFSTFNADAVGDVSLYKGAYPAEHGGRLGAVLDVRTRDAVARSIAGKAGVSTIASRLALEGPLGRGSWTAGARRTHLEPMLELIRDDDTDVPDYYFYDVNAKLALPLAGGKAEVSLYTGGDQLDFLPDENTFLNLDWGNTVATGSFVRTLGENLLATARLSFSDYASHTTGTAFTTPASFENGVRDYTAAADLQWTAGLRHTLTGGMQVSRYEAAFSRNLNTETLFDYRRTPIEAAAFLEDRWRPWSETVVDGGLRVRYLDDGERWLFEPRLALAHAVSDELRFKLGGGLYHQYLQLVATEAISAADFYVPIDASTDIGRSVQVTGGVDWIWRPSWLASVEAYYTDLDHLVLLDNSTAVGSDVATADDLFYLDGTGYAGGVELFLRRDVGPWTGWAGYSLGWTRRTFPEVNDGNEFPPKYDRRHDVSVALEHTRGPWRFTGAFVYATGQAFTPVNGRYSLRDPTTGVIPDDIELLYADKNSARLLPYNRLDLGVARDFSLFGARAEWLVEIFNVYSRRNEWFVDYQRDGSVVTADVARMLPIIPSIGVNLWF